MEKAIASNGKNVAIFKNAMEIDFIELENLLKNDNIVSLQDEVHEAQFTCYKLPDGTYLSSDMGNYESTIVNEKLFIESEMVFETLDDLISEYKECLHQL
jgi:hypothetical protein